ncbi:hypothetical protein LIX60_27645 [Streptomyces sp. S07_1.15]|uniref:hypothetical protein n=1 Tax=Streptomyces sp. S07_1.15 TaxID=2873925 RepID=UPI001D151D7D|nr:hypothetical protein [Streptomyces sp. S07_1.15]MCC3655172.1 hypothetical protein [Streptomyces sp. S07_1.15]
MGGDARRGAGVRAAVREGETPGGARFALFAECLLTGVWVLIAALPLVTLLPAFAAGCGHLRRHLAGERCTRREFAAGLREAVRTGLGWSLLWWTGIALLAVDLWVAGSGALPGAVPMAAAAWAGLAVLTVTGLRTAAGREPGGCWARAAAGALRRTCVTDPGGSALLIGGLAVVAVAAGQQLPLAAPALGCLVACAVAVERRCEARVGQPDGP